MINELTVIIMLILAVGIMTSPVYAAACPPAVPASPATPTEFDLNLLNLNGSNIDLALPVTIDYLDADSCPQSLNSVDDPDQLVWSIYNDKSNAYTLVSAKDGTDVNVTVEGYEMLQVIAAEGLIVSGDFYLPRISTTTTTTITTTSTTTTTTTTIPGQTTTTTTTTTTTIPAAACPPPVPASPATPTEFDLNLLNLDGSNIDLALPVTIDYLDADTCPQSLNSVDDPDKLVWSIYNDKSNAYTLVPAKDGTDVNVTVEGYEMLQVIAAEGLIVSGDYNLHNFPPHNTMLEYAAVPINTPWNINITWADATGVDTAWLVRNGTDDKYYPDITTNTADGKGKVFSWNSYNETQAGQINITAYANDTNGNSNSNNPISFTYQVIDTTKINIDLESPKPNQSYNIPVLISGRVFTSDTANVSYSLNNGDLIPIANNITTVFSINVSDGIKPNKLNNLIVYAVNYYNGNDNTTKNVSFYVDATYPDISYNLGTTGSGAYKTLNWIFINVSASDDQGIKPDTLVLDFNGTSNTSWEHSGTDYWINVTTKNIQGVYNISVSVEDLAGNVNRTDPLIVVIDRKETARHRLYNLFPFRHPEVEGG